MTSLYSTRSRKANQTQQCPHNPIKDQELSPKTSTRLKRSFPNTSSIKVEIAEKQPYSTPQLAKTQRETHLSLLSNPEHLNLEHSSSCNNDSSGCRQKSNKKQSDSDRIQPYVSSLLMEQLSLFGSLQIDKQISKKSDDVFINEKKSYRTQFNKRTVGVPYRKCHSTMEEKVVGIINKINSGKECQKEIETLLDRTKKISIKEMMNRYFVSGLHVIYRLVKKDRSGVNFDNNLVQNIQQCLLELKEKIEGELDSPKAYEVVRSPLRVHEFPREKLIARAFKILRKKQREQQIEEAQKKAIETANWFIENNHNDMQVFLDELIRC